MRILAGVSSGTTHLAEKSITMDRQLFEDQNFQGQDFSIDGLPAGTYESCLFSACQFQGLDLSDYRFSDCTFADCDLSNIITTETALQEVVFRGCKLLGIHFSACRTFRLAMEFDNCRLDFSSFSGLPMTDTRFTGCQLLEVDFTETDLSGATFDECSLLRSQFVRTQLPKADLRTARDFIIDPNLNNITGAKFSYTGLAGLLSQYRLEIE